jgi:hypothetical protein
MANLADEEAHGDWLAERPDADDPPEAYLLDDLVSSARYAQKLRGQVCTCGPNPASDRNHTCTIHPPF